MKKLSTTILFIVFFLCVKNINASTIVTRVSGTAHWGDASSWIKFIDGEIRMKAGSNVLNGKGTNFLRDLKPGDQILSSSSPQKIVGIVGNVLSEVSLQLESIEENSFSGAFGITAVPSAGDKVIIGNNCINGNLKIIYDLKDAKIASLTFSSVDYSSTLIHEAGSVLKIENDVIINQPLLDKHKNIWEIGASTVYTGGSLFSSLSTSTGNRMVEIIINGGSLTVDKDFSCQAIGNNLEQKITIDQGTFSVNGQFKLRSGLFASKGNTILNFNKEFIFGGANLPQFRTDSGTNLIFRSDIDLKDMISNLVLSPNSRTMLKGSVSISTPPTVAILSFGNLQIDENASVVLKGNIWVSGNLLSKGGNIYCGNNTVWLSGRNKTIGGTGNANLGNISIYGGRSSSYTVVSNVSCNKVTFPSSISQSSMNIQKGVILTVLGDLTILQPAVPATTSFNIGDGSAQVSGDVTLGGKYQISSQISKISIIDGALDVGGNMVFNSSPKTPQTAVVDMSEGVGTINLKGQFINSNNMGLLNTGIDEKRLHMIEVPSPAL